MKRIGTVALIAALSAIGMLCVFFQGLFYSSEVKREGIRAQGEVQLKDSVPMPDGSLDYNVTFLYQDQDQRNHQVKRRVPSKSAWDRLRQTRFPMRL